MASSLREKFDKKKMTKKKHLARRINEVARQVAEMDKWCRACGSQFDPKVPGALDTWLVTVGHDSTFLTCPECHKKTSTCSTPTPEL
jgi:hypothetical protein